VEKLIQTTVELKRIPDAEDICEKQMYALMDRVVKTPIDEEAIDRYWPVFYNKLKGIPAEEIVLKFISAELNTFLEYYKGSGDLNASQEKGRPERGREKEGSREGGNRNRNLTGEKKRFYINLGENQNLNKGALVRLVCSEAGIESSHVGRIELNSRNAFFEVDEKVANQIVPALKNGVYEGKSFEVSLAQDKESGKMQGKKKRH
jgi:ATP-dependent RNA helicase DeaD